MDFKALGDWLSGEIGVALHVSFWVAVGVGALIIWRWLKHHYQGRLDTKDDLIKLREAQLQDYKDKLSGATPDEAKARMDALEARLMNVEPRQLTQAQQAKLTAAAAPFAGSSIEINADGSTTDAGTLQQSLLQALFAANWNVSHGMVLGPNHRMLSPSGIAIEIPDLASRPSACLVIANALDDAGIGYEFRQASVAIPRITISHRSQA